MEELLVEMVKFLNGYLTFRAPTDAASIATKHAMDMSGGSLEGKKNCSCLSQFCIW